MFRRTAAIVTLAAIALLSPATAIVARAEDGRGPVPTVRPPQGVLRHVDAERDAAPTAAPASHGQRNEVVLIVGGYQSCSCDASFEALTERAKGDGFDVVRFGQDPRFPYDAYGSVPANAVNLRDEARALATEYGAVHIVTHSGGGVVADQAFAAGLSHASASSYVSWSGPHSGSVVGRYVQGVTPLLDAVAGDDEFTRSVFLRLGWETKSDAMDGIIWAHPPLPPIGVRRLDIREASDLAVLAPDANDRNAPSLLLPALPDPIEGHGGILSDGRAIDETMSTIEGRPAPKDRQSLLLEAAAQAESFVLADLVVPLLPLGCALLCGVALFYRFGGRKRFDDVFGPAHRRRCW